MRLLLGVIKPDTGRALVDGMPVNEMCQKTRALRMGYVPQEGGLFPHFTAGENATLVARSIGWSRRKAVERLLELASVVSLDRALLKRYPSQLSGGQRQRAALMRAAFLSPPLLLLDEPLGALDPIARTELQTELKAIFKRLGTTVLFVTHDIGEADYLAERILLLHQGKLVQDGAMRDLVERPANAFVSQFIGAQRILAKSDPKEDH